MIISGWCIVAIIALISGAITSMKINNEDSFGASVILTIFIGFGYLITLGY